MRYVLFALTFLMGSLFSASYRETVTSSSFISKPNLLCASDISSDTEAFFLSSMVTSSSVKVNWTLYLTAT